MPLGQPIIAKYLDRLLFIGYEVLIHLVYSVHSVGYHSLLLKAYGLCLSRYFECRSHFSYTKI